MSRTCRNQWVFDLKLFQVKVLGRFDHNALVDLPFQKLDVLVFLVQKHVADIGVHTHVETVFLDFERLPLDISENFVADGSFRLEQTLSFTIEARFR